MEQSPIPGRFRVSSRAAFEFSPSEVEVQRSENRPREGEPDDGYGLPVPTGLRLPSHAQLAWPLLTVLKRRPAGMSNHEMEAAVAAELSLSAELREIRRGGPRSSRSLLDYRLAWARTLLKGLGAVENPRPAFWAATAQGHELTPSDIQAAIDAMLVRLSSSEQQQ